MTDSSSDPFQMNQSTTWFEKLLLLFVLLFSIGISTLAVWKAIDLIILFVNYH